MIKINRMIFYIHESEELILLKCPYYTKPFIAPSIKIPIALIKEI